MFHFHADQTCTAYNPYSGAVVALNAISAWVVQQLTHSGLSIVELTDLLIQDAKLGFDDEVDALLDSTVKSLVYEARIVSTFAGP